MSERRIAITYFDRAGYVLARGTTLMLTDPVLPGWVEKEVTFHAPGSAHSALVHSRLQCEPMLYDLSKLPNRTPLHGAAG